ncbi:TaqI-like C-terminal specificity domain-containing protein [Weeksella virosa]|uniref:TaqI-like C-terminal specificity domain-containing protein n=1 Tax=Weeksella virosa TaxID=1014 RepID=UPI001C8817D2|nr:TaqI-like C-terminal specificity domain-containing protein [Weeksella virosa]
MDGYNEAFIIDGKKKDELIAEDPKSAEIIRPLLRGRDIKRYSYDFADKYLIATFPSKNYNIDEFPAIKQFLIGFYPKLKQTGENLTAQEIKAVLNHAKTHGIPIKESSLKKSRKKTTNKWFETQDSISYWEDFSRQKIMYSEIVREPQFYLDKNGEFFAEATSFIMTGEHLEYLYHLLNSKTATYFFKTFYAGGSLGNEGFRYKKAFLEKLPIPINNENIEINKDNANDVIFKLYKLDTSEIEFLENQL